MKLMSITSLIFAQYFFAINGGQGFFNLSPGHAAGVDNIISPP